MSTFMGRFRKLFATKKQKLPSFIEVDVDPKRHWNILEDIGEGSFGAVKKVSRKSNPNQLAAFKCTEIQEGEEVEDLAIEVEILLACVHENVVGILAAYFHDNCLSVMLEYCSGGAVDQIIIELDKALNESQIAAILKQVCTGLAFLHSKFVIHRDLKAGNLLLTNDGLVKIADFGVSCMLNNAEEGNNTFIGTPHWMSPEVIRCETMTNLLYNCKADIWSLGITCIQLAQKEPPYHELSAERVRLKILRCNKPPTLDNPNTYSSAFRDFISRCLVINPDERCSAVDLLSHPFIVNVVDRKPIMILLLEMSADFSEEPVFDNNGSCANSICSSDGTSLWSRQDELVNTTTESENSNNYKNDMEIPSKNVLLDSEKTPMSENSAIQSKKKRAAPAPPNTEDFVNNVECIDIILPDPEKETASARSYMSPSGKEAMDILNDLNDVLDENCQSSSESRPSSRASSAAHSQKANKQNRPRLSSNPKEPSDSLPQNKEEDITFNNGESTVIKCLTPTHSIKEAVQRYASDPGTTNRKSTTSSDSGHSRTSQQNHQPVLLQVNADDEEHNVGEIHNRSQSETAGDSSRVTAVEIPSGLVKKNLKLAQKEKMADHARAEAEKIKEQRMKEDAAIFGKQQNHVSELAASLTSKLLVENESVKDAPKKEEKAVKTEEIVNSDNNFTKLVSNQPYNYFTEDNNKMTKEVPPPEPPVDYDETPKAEPIQNNKNTEAASTPKFKRSVKKIVISQGKENTEPKKEVLVRRTPSRQTATKRTRTYTVDGEQVTSITTHVLEAKQNYELRRQQEREYLRMQREEAKQRNGHEKKSAVLQEAQEKNFTQEKTNLEKEFLGDIEAISKTQKKKIEEIERAQEEEIKQLVKRLKNDQEKQIRMFKDQLAREQKLLKQDVDVLPKAQRKDTYRYRKEILDREHLEREMQFLQKLDREHDMFLEKLRASHREKVAFIERQFLEHKHKAEQSLMSALWELEERQLTERHALNTQQLKELYLLQRSQMIARHQKELELVRRHIHEEEDRLMRDLSTNRKNLPKSLRAESKTRIRIFKESLSIDFQHLPEKWEQFIQNFEENEKQRVKTAIEEYEQKCKKRMDNLIEENQQLLKELEQIHTEKRSMLCDNEQQMLAECEQQFQQLLQEARANRPVRKAELERRFKEEMERQMKFYNMAATA